MYQYSSPRISDSLHTEALPHNIHLVLQSLRQLEDSYGLHPFTFQVLEEASSRKKIFSGVTGGEKIPENACLVVLAIRPTISRDLINNYISDITNRKKVSRDSLTSYRKHFEGTINKTDPEGRNWSEKQADVALDALKEAARETNVQVSIVEQFDKKQADQLLDLPARGLRSLCVIALNPLPGKSSPSPTLQKAGQKEWSRN